MCCGSPVWVVSFEDRPVRVPVSPQRRAEIKQSPVTSYPPPVALFGVSAIEVPGVGLSLAI
jgi:hypothetical protein